MAGEVKLVEGPLAAYRALVSSGDIESDPRQELAVEKLQLLHHRLNSYRIGKPRLRLFGKPEPTPEGIYIYGGVGRGKSMLMDMFFDVAPTTPKRRIHFHEFMIETHAAIHEWRQMNDRERATRFSALGLRLPKGSPDDPILPVARMIASRATLLCFDEFQVTDVTDAMILGRLFGALFEEGVIMVVTSNRAPDDLYKGGLNRQLFVPFIDLLKSTLDILHLDGARDYRLERLQGLDVFHVPLSQESKSEMDAAWLRLTHVKNGDQHTLDVQGRTLMVPEAAMGVARMTFVDLCDRPLGAADYLALARNFHTVMIDGIPRMNKEHRNQAKRFVTLIDALYENKVKLICSADSPPTELYQSGDGAFEFERTVSRLIEMQSEEYLAAGHGV